jgi:hypothetical protein
MHTKITLKSPGNEGAGCAYGDDRREANPCFDRKSPKGNPFRSYAGLGHPLWRFPIGFPTAFFGGAWQGLDKKSRKQPHAQ